MHSFVSRFAGVVRGVLNGFDRLFFRGSLRQLSYLGGLREYLRTHDILLKDFGSYSAKMSAQVEMASLRHAHQLGREVRYLNSSQYRKEDIARQIAARDRIRSGLICVLRSVDPCMSFQVSMNYQTHKLELHYRPRKCMHLYHYLMHPLFGFMHVRIQTWFPFRAYVCLNGREWLAHQMDQAKLGYRRRDNTFTWVEDLQQAQALLQQQVQAPWPQLLGDLVAQVNPLHAERLPQYHYYWSLSDSEWASDVMFSSRAALTALYPKLLRYAVTTFGAPDVLRFLGKPVPASGKVPHAWRHDVSTNLKERVEGARIKHWLNGNSIKMYDKLSVLRVETMIREPGEFKVLRTAQGDDHGVPDWRPVRQGVVDLPHRASVSQAANERYLEACAAVKDETPLRQLVEPLCQAVQETTAAQAKTAALTDATTTAAATGAARPRRVRALNPLAAADATLLEAVSRHEFLINGLRNRDLRALLYPATEDADEQRRQAAAITRKLRLLRAHGLIAKVPKTHRYLVTDAGRRVITALLSARNANADAFNACAA